MNKLALMTGVDIPIPELQLTLHQPRIKEISYMDNEMSYFLTLQLITFDKRILLAQASDQDKNRLLTMDDFDIFMMLLTDQKVENSHKRQSDFLAVLTIMFPGYIPQLLPRSIYLNNPTTKHNITIDNNNFLALKEVIIEVGGLKNNSASENGNFNPKGERAAKIAAKLMKGRQIAASQQQQNGSGSILSRYVSILTVGLHSMSLEDCNNLTVFQLYDLIERYQLNLGWDIDIRARLAGASPDDKPEDWMKDIH